METRESNQPVETESKQKFFNVPERVSHLVGVIVFYAAVFLIITLLAEGLKFFNEPDPVQPTNNMIIGSH